MLSERQLIEGCVKGDRNCQKLLYERYSGYFFGICLRYMPNSLAAEDVLIDGFASIFNKLETYEYKGVLVSWMRQIIINALISALRSDKRNSFEDLPDYFDNIVSENENISSEMNANDIMKLIQKLPVGYRTVFNLCAIEGYPYQEAADLLGVKIGTVRSQLAKARKILQKQLKDYR
ncbi:MAG: RNA polymerase sigma factor [Bacteroidales bacterium]|jgi:RNA polymerase sigma-70 factor (ECF subfamily)|nr:RNA polymerase sigma factor [Bacteroidales bacterium]